MIDTVHILYSVLNYSLGGRDCLYDENFIKYMNHVEIFHCLEKKSKTSVIKSLIKALCAAILFSVYVTAITST